MKDPLTGETFRSREEFVLHILSRIKDSHKARIQYATVIAVDLADFCQNDVDARIPMCYSLNDEDTLLNVELISDIMFYIFDYPIRFKFGSDRDYPIPDKVLRYISHQDETFIVRLAEELPKLLYLSLPLTVTSSRTLFPMYLKSFPDSDGEVDKSVCKYIYEPEKESASSIIGYMTNSYWALPNEDVYTGIYEKPMLKITKESSFAAAHQLPYHKGLCGYVHGHEWKFEIEVQLPHINEEGLLIDFADLKRTMQRFVVNRLDHCFINDVLYNPTAENLAVWIWKRLAFGVLGLLRVTVWESPTSSATFDLREVV